MGTDITVNEKKYIICYNLDTPLLHYVVLEPGQHLSTGQPEIELYDSEDEVIDRMIELGFNPDDYIKKYTFLLYSTVFDAQNSMDEINRCLGELYIMKYFTIINNINGEMMGYAVLIDDKIKTCLTPTQITHIMTVSSSDVSLF